MLAYYITDRISSKDRCSVQACLSSRRHPGTLYCQKHGCKVPACIRPTKGPSEFCQEHTCRRDKCARQGSEGVGSLCEAHKCKVIGCRGEARFENGFCSTNHACAEPECRKPRIAIPGDPDVQRCLDHERAGWRAAGRRVAMEELRAEFQQEREEWRLQKLQLEARIALMERDERLRREAEERQRRELEERQRRELEERQRREMEERPRNVRDTWGPGPRRFSYGRETRTPGPGEWYSRGGGFGSGL